MATIYPFPQRRQSIEAPSPHVNVAGRMKPKALKKPKEKKLRLKKNHFYKEGELTLDGAHRYCQHIDVFCSFEMYERGHIPGTRIFHPSAEADKVLKKMREHFGEEAVSAFLTREYHE